MGILKKRVDYRFPKYRFLKLNQKLAKIFLNRLNSRLQQHGLIEIVQQNWLISIVRSDAIISRFTCFKMKNLFYLRVQIDVGFCLK